MQNLILLELNELIFPYVESYIERGKLPGFQTLLRRHGYHVTDSEKSYAHLEPWIQWVSAHTGLPYDAHKIFRLGDIIGATVPQIFEVLEKRGVSVGAVSPMNVENRLSAAAFFVPDPWTNSKVTGAADVHRLYGAISRAVNENASGRLSPADALYLLEGLLRHGSPTNAVRYLELALGSLRKPWRRALFLDLLMSDLFLDLWLASRPQFGVLFLNAAAHVQHHYLFSSQSYRGEHRNPAWYVPPGCDPVLEIYEMYDKIVSRVMALDPQPRILVATGLSQEPYPKPIYYHRLREHQRFLKLLGIKCSKVEARMSRDFLVSFLTDEEARQAQKILESAADYDGIHLFEVDNRGTSLFVTLVYEKEIPPGMSARYSRGSVPELDQHVSFVALKNGHHIPRGYVIDTNRSSPSTAEIPITDLYDEVLAHFGAQRAH